MAIDIYMAEQEEEQLSQNSQTNYADAVIERASHTYLKYLISSFE